MNKKIQTPSQTVGPYFAYGLTPEQYLYDFKSLCDGDLILNESIEGQRIIIRGKVYDGDNQLIPDAMIEIWQADSKGIYNGNNKGFRGFGRYGTGSRKDNSFEFTAIKPGKVGDQAPHINVIVFMRGLLSHLYTRMYFPEETSANSNDKILQEIDSSRRGTLIAQKEETANGLSYYLFNIRTQGDNETVFFDI